MYLDINEQLDRDFEKIGRIITFAKGAKILLDMDSNARSTSWHDILTNTRGRALEEYISSKNLYIINETSTKTTFHTRRGSSNIDLTIINNLLVPTFSE
jgi:hypothetical protein